VKESRRGSSLIAPVGLEDPGQVPQDHRLGAGRRTRRAPSGSNPGTCARPRPQGRNESEAREETGGARREEIDALRSGDRRERSACRTISMPTPAPREPGSTATDRSRALPELISIPAVATTRPSSFRDQEAGQTSGPPRPAGTRPRAARGSRGRSPAAARRMRIMGSEGSAESGPAASPPARRRAVR
jgi:hypothetical protein